MIPPRPAVIAHGKVLRKRTPALYSGRGCPARLLVSSARLRHHACRGSLDVSLMRLPRAGSLGSRLETSRQKATVPILLWVVPTIACWSVAYVHTAADLHARLVS